jgi:hypothetical protein
MENNTLMKKLGIKPEQVSKRRDVMFAEYFERVKVQAQDDIVNIICGDILTQYDRGNIHWILPSEVVQTIFDAYKIIASHRKTKRRLGSCSYSDKVIRINFGHPFMDEAQCYKTLVHEYIHAICYTVFGRRAAGHGDVFRFYLNLIYYSRWFREPKYKTVASVTNRLSLSKGIKEC